MEIDLERAGGDLRGLSPLSGEVCIVGAGIAGLLLGDKLARSGVDVILLEAGGRSTERSEQQFFAAAKLAGTPHVGTREGRTRALGGNSVTWGAQLLPLTNTTGWPLELKEVSAFQREAELALGVDDVAYEGATFFEAADSLPSPDGLEQLPDLQARLSKFAPFSKRNLAHSLGNELLRHEKARVVLHAQATEILLDPSGRAVESVKVRTRAGAEISVKATHFVLAAGTVETCRLLLASRSFHPEGVGNGRDQVGRGFHDHLTTTAATFHETARKAIVAQFRPWMLDGVGGTVHALKLEAGWDLRQKLELNPALAHFTFEEPPDSGLGALRDLLRSRQGGREVNLPEAVRGLPRALGDGLRLYRQVSRDHRRYISDHALVALRLNVAQETPGSSRITLSRAEDVFGQPQAIVDWRIASSDYRTLQRFAHYLREHLARLGLDEASGAHWHPHFLDEVEDARHAMGGAIMDTDPRASVVDGDLRVHGIENLYVASAAVFPDGRAQLPTLTLMSLCLRLAGRLRHELTRA